jgi:hypothetical protein
LAAECIPPLSQTFLQGLKPRDEDLSTVQGQLTEVEGSVRLTCVCSLCFIHKKKYFITFMLLFATKEGKEMVSLYLENIKILKIWVET